MEDMRKFEKPEMEVIVFEAEDIITNSIGSDKDRQNGDNGEESLGMDISEFMSDGSGDITEPTVQTTSEGTAEAANSANQSDALEEVVEDEPVIEEPVMTEEVVEDIIEE